MELPDIRARTPRFSLFLTFIFYIDARVANETPLRRSAGVLAGCLGSVSLPNTRGRDALTTASKMLALQNAPGFFCLYETQ